jgi:hypothetical protein
VNVHAASSGTGALFSSVVGNCCSAAGAGARPKNSFTDSQKEKSAALVATAAAKMSVIAKVVITELRLINERTDDLRFNMGKILRSSCCKKTKIEQGASPMTEGRAVLTPIRRKNKTTNPT